VTRKQPPKVYEWNVPKETIIVSTYNSANTEILEMEEKGFGAN